jgi:hypothetical protein
MSRVCLLLVAVVAACGSRPASQAAFLPARTPCRAPRAAPQLGARRPGALQLRAAHASRTLQVAAFETLVAWLEEGGEGRVHSAVELAEADGDCGRGLRVAAAVLDGELLASIPRAKQIWCPPDDAEARGDVSTHTRLGLALLREKLQDSTFDPYLQMLPHSYDSMPLYYVQDIPELQFAPVEQEAVARIQELLRITQSLDGGAVSPFEGADVDFEQVLWAYGTASSRALRPHSLPGGHVHALVPLVDLINHSFDANCRLVDEGGGAVGLRAARPLVKGECLRLCYGPFPNDKLLLDYGFSDEENPHDFVRLPAGALSYALQESVANFQRALALNETEDFLSEAEARELSAAQLLLLQACNLTDVRTVFISHDGEVEPRSMALVRVLVLRSPGEAAGVSSALEVQENKIEERARDVICRLCTLALQQLSTSTSHDMRLVHGDGGPGNDQVSENNEGREVDGEGHQGAEVEWEGKTRSEVGPAMSAVKFRLLHKHILNRAILVHR